MAGVFNKFVSLIFVFVVRYFFARNLDVELLGLEGLFSNILGVFSLVDAGLGSAIAFGLYKPLYENDRDTVSAIMVLYKKVYTVVGVVVLFLSIFVSPFVPVIIKDTTVEHKSIITFFLVYAIGVAVSYFFAYKRTLVFAIQKNYIVLVIDTITKILLSVLQIAILITIQCYFCYLALVVFFNFLSNVLISVIVKKNNIYDEKCNKKLPKEYTKKLITDVKALAVANISWIGISSTSNIIISSIVGAIDLAKNANYSTITLNIAAFINMFLGGVSASVGDMLAEANKEKINRYFFRYNFIYQFVSGYASVAVFLVSKPFVSLWVGENLVFDVLTTVIISAYLYLTIIFKPLADYQNYSGLFIYYKLPSIIALGIDLIVSIALGEFFGIKGVFLGLIITYMYMMICVAYNVHRRLLEISVKKYLMLLLKNIVCILITATSVFLILKLSNVSGFVEMLFAVLLLTVIYFLVSSIVFFKDESFRFFIDFALKQVKKVLIRRN